MGLTVRDVTSIRQRRASTNHETYKMLYHVACRRIEACAKADRDNSCSFECEYIVPSFVFGRPCFDNQRAARYIKDKLVNGGFGVTIDGAASRGPTLLISWSVGRPVQQTKKKKKKDKEKNVDIDRALKRLQKNLGS